jgi:hypothetical protein
MRKDAICSLAHIPEEDIEETAETLKELVKAPEFENGTSQTHLAKVGKYVLEVRFTVYSYSFCVSLNCRILRGPFSLHLAKVLNPMFFVDMLKVQDSWQV